MIWRWFWREWKSPSLLIVWLALTLAVACVLALGSLSDRMEKGLTQQSRDFMAGDRTLQSSREVPQAWLDKAREAGLQVGRQLTFMTMTFSGDVPQLAAVKAVDDLYPMFGKLVTRPPELKPAEGTVLAAPRLLALLNLKVGDNIDVGDTTLRIVGEVIQEPDSGFNPFQTVPGLLMNLADVQKTGAVQPGSRLTWRYKFSGTPVQLAGYDRFIESNIRPDQRWISIDNSDDALGKSVQRAQQFLLLSSLLTLMLAIAALTVAMSHYCRSRYDLIAVLKTLGANRAALSKLIVGQWLAVLLLAGVSGSLMGVGFERVLLKMLQPVLPGVLPAASAWPWLWAMGALFIISFMVGVRPYRLLLATQPLRVLRRDAVANIWPLKYYLPAMALLVVAMLSLLVGGSKLLWVLVGGIVLLSLLLGGIGWLGLKMLRRLSIRSLPFRLAAMRLLCQPWTTLSQLAAFSFSFMLLALLLVMRGDLLERWQQQLPSDSPNYFLLNLTRDQVPQVNSFLQQHHVEPQSFYPVVRARLTEINHQQADPSRDNALNRELNLTWQDRLPDHNPLTAGNWPPQKGEVSMEVTLAERLGVGPGDTLTFTADTQTFSAKVTSLRKVDWESLKPNFLFIFPSHVLDDQPQAWLTSFRLEGNSELLAQLNRRFPTLNLLDIGAILRQIDQVLAQISRAMEIMVVLVTACGGLLLLAQVQVGMRQRRQELVVWRTLGASKKLLRATLWYEFALLGLVSGVAAAIGTEVALWGLQRKVFDFPWQPDFLLWITLPLAGAVLLSLCGGWLGVRLLKGKALFRHYHSD
ncbi:ABC transporter permease [Erwinia tracheiphila]|uniref:ABC transporter permease n=1 Tax=Erwinia tracheiphila TaxID=65700 RepID=A0A345CPL6_9GAMM|nr:putative ABC transporter permease subunit YbbP [Erwinia tracheiphila]AXF75383.1 ABC transporter permease [Erwinia tracheiphila]UIA82074.1 ABC transporter permease [Erwinia tracheiphila]UIA90669.1 ABC transporter permease [Erwinia tracheiphila]